MMRGKKKYKNRAEVFANVLSIIKAERGVDASETTLVKDLEDILVIAKVRMTTEEYCNVDFETAKGLDTVGDVVNHIAETLKLSG